MTLGYDNLKLSNLLKEKLIETNYFAAKRTDARGFVFVDADEMSGAVLPAGNYEIQGDSVKVSVNPVTDEEVLI